MFVSGKPRATAKRAWAQAALGLKAKAQARKTEEGIALETFGSTAAFALRWPRSSSWKLHFRIISSSLLFCFLFSVFPQVCLISFIVEHFPRQEVIIIAYLPSYYLQQAIRCVVVANGQGDIFAFGSFGFIRLSAFSFFSFTVYVLFVCQRLKKKSKPSFIGKKSRGRGRTMNAFLWAVWQTDGSGDLPQTKAVLCRKPGESSAVPPQLCCHCFFCWRLLLRPSAVLRNPGQLHTYFNFSIFFTTLQVYTYLQTKIHFTSFFGKGRPLALSNCRIINQ